MDHYRIACDGVASGQYYPNGMKVYPSQQPKTDYDNVYHEESRLPFILMFAFVGGFVGGLIGIVGGPPGIAIGIAMGAVVGGALGAVIV